MKITILGVGANQSQVMLELGGIHAVGEIGQTTELASVGVIARDLDDAQRALALRALVELAAIVSRSKRAD